MKFFAYLSSFLFLGLVALPALAQQQAEQRDDNAVASPFPAPRAVTRADGFRPHVGVQLGYADQAADYKGTLGYGIEVGMQPYIPYSVGLALSSYTAKNTDSSKEDFSRTKLLAHGNFNFGGDLPLIRYSYVGVGVGPVFDDAPEGNRIRLGTNLGLGFDVPLGKPDVENRAFTAGANANYLMVSDSGVDTFALNGVVKYWF